MNDKEPGYYDFLVNQEKRGMVNMSMLDFYNTYKDKIKEKPEEYKKFIDWMGEESK